VQADLVHDGRSFVSGMLADPRFLTVGVVDAHDHDCWWAVVDPLRHPLGVWSKCGPRFAAYARSAQALGAAIFTNGPMMGKRLGPKCKLTRGVAAREFAMWTVAGAVGGLLASSGLGLSYLAGIGGAALGMAQASRRVFTGWVPCGGVFSRDDGIDDRRIFDGETHAWFGRFATDFASYRIAPGDLPQGVCEGLGGLILLVRDFKAASAEIGDPAFNRDFAQLSKKKGVVAWGLVPFDHGRSAARGDSYLPGARSRVSEPTPGADEAGPDATRTPPLEGVIVVIGGPALDCEVAAARLCAIGARDAVAMDQSGCIMMGAARNFMIGPPSLHRQEMQIYGLYCR
jgi:hypothetical protein